MFQEYLWFFGEEDCAASPVTQDVKLLVVIDAISWVDFCITSGLMLNISVASQLDSAVLSAVQEIGKQVRQDGFQGGKACTNDANVELDR
jgi:hypothetical protein